MFELLIQGFTTDKDGRVTQRTRRRKAHSFVYGWVWATCAQLLSESAPAPALGPVTDVLGINYNLRTCQNTLDLAGLLGVATPGIVVGTGNSPIRVNQTKLDAVIGQGTGVGQMEHQAQTWTFTGIVGTQASFAITRSFVNLSGAQIDVREAGFYMGVFDGVPATRIVLAARDLASHDVPYGGAVTLTYTVRIVL